MEGTTKLLLDPVQKRCACVILQALAGGDRQLAHEFGDWLTAPTPNMRVVSGTPNEFRELARLWNEKP